MNEKAKIYHSESYKTLDDVIDYKLTTIIKLWDKLPQLMIKRCPEIRPEMMLRNLALFSCLYVTGGRASELTTITLQDITFEDKWMYIKLENRKNKKNKKKEIIVDLTIEKRFIKWLIDYMKYRLKNSESLEEPLFITDWQHKIGNYPITRVCIYHVTTKYMNVNPHFFRKLRASHLLEYYNMDLKSLQQYLGWSTILSSEPYLRISKAGIKRNFEKSRTNIENIIGENK